MKQHWEQKAVVPVEESNAALTVHLAELEATHEGLKHDLLRQQEIARQLEQAVRELETRNLEMSVGLDQALGELQE